MQSKKYKKQSKLLLFYVTQQNRTLNLVKVKCAVIKISLLLQSKPCTFPTAFHSITWQILSSIFAT